MILFSSRNSRGLENGLSPEAKLVNGMVDFTRLVSCQTLVVGLQQIV